MMACEILILNVGFFLSQTMTLSHWCTFVTYLFKSITYAFLNVCYFSASYCIPWVIFLYYLSSLQQHMHLPPFFPSWAIERFCLFWVVWSLLRSSSVNNSAIKFLEKKFGNVCLCGCLKKTKYIYTILNLDDCCYGKTYLNH